MKEAAFQVKRDSAHTWSGELLTLRGALISRDVRCLTSTGVNKVSALGFRMRDLWNIFCSLLAYFEPHFVFRFSATTGFAYSPAGW